MATAAEKCVHWEASVFGWPIKTAAPAQELHVKDDETETKCFEHRAELVGENEYNHDVHFNIE